MAEHSRNQMSAIFFSKRLFRISLLNIQHWGSPALTESLSWSARNVINAPLENGQHTWGCLGESFERCTLSSRWRRTKLGLLIGHTNLVCNV